MLALKWVLQSVTLLLLESPLVLLLQLQSPSASASGVLSPQQTNPWLSEVLHSPDPAHGGRIVVSAHLHQQSTEGWPMSAEGRLTVVVISVEVVGEAASLPYN